MSSSLRGEFNQTQTIPSSILQTVRQQGHGASNTIKKSGNTVKLPPLSLLTSEAGTQGNGSPAGIWNHPNQRQRFKHLTDKTQCLCGAGRDISFLYDSSIAPKIAVDNVPKSLVPEEFRVVKNTGVMGLLLHDEPYAVNLENHEKHLTAFPSLNPSGRQEVLALKSTLQQMAERSGIGNNLIDTDLSGPTQMHNLIALVKKEQEIYNICFYELIRQVSVGCMERGALLAEIRDCYANLLNKIPFQVKSLHDEVLAQRALDRKLTSELGRFKNLMSSLTGELSELRDHNELAEEEIKETKDGLSFAISESEKNANLLVEYCGLYELQRKRLEDQIALLTQEKDLWELTSYQLAVKVAKKRQLKTVQRIQLSGKSWEKLGTHFTILMADRDTKDLCTVQEGVLEWRRQLVSFTKDLSKVEEDLITKLNEIENDMKEWLEKINNSSTTSTPSKGDQSIDRYTKITQDKTFCNSLSQAVSNWLQLLNDLSDIFSGEVLLERQEQLIELEKSMKKWSNISVSIVQHHVSPCSKNITKVTSNHDDITNECDDGYGHHVPVHSMEGVNIMVGELNMYVKDLAVRTAGENGVAVAFVHLITPMETWDTKLNLMMTSETKHLVSSDIKRLVSQINDWLKTIHDMINKVFKSNKTDPTSNNGDGDYDSVTIVSQSVDKWSVMFSRAIQVEDGQVIEQVAHTHSSLVKWMSSILLYLTSSEEGDNPSLDTPPTNDDGSVSHISVQQDSSADLIKLKSTYIELCESLNRITKEISTNCNLIFIDTITNSTSSEINLETEGEKEELQMFCDEAVNWIRLGDVLLDVCMSQHKKEMEDTKKQMEEKEEVERKQIEEQEMKKMEEQEMERMEEQEENDNEENGTTQSSPKKEKYTLEEKKRLLKTVMTIDSDDNVTEIDNTYPTTSALSQKSSSLPLKKLGLTTEEELPEGRGALLKDAEKLLLDLDNTKTKLTEQELITRSEQERAETAEIKLKATEEELANVRNSLDELQRQYNEQQQIINNKNKKTSKTPKSKDKRK